ncbi:LacI family DNA-binding transcriptional regulator [Puniceicoccus vermicola]|uniref:LacI family DNA-binding transcriptional regulator n=1 Tax=Puniceicoccus vermicola TaxID=388746 RepID=A0A7X1E517_9BACT|nr:LacI family DNA-binding transcriptional regulator [Puniceicoccus vermicola]MBC2602583.1 LacI family DNA-binding transcriptional regulator [Puniceicoccus vermicola]
MARDDTVTMKDIAREAKVSASAVSLALRGSPRISELTRTRISEIAERMGYRPNPLVSALMQSRRRPHQEQGFLTGAYLSFEEMAPVLREESIYAEFERGAMAEAARQGIRLEKFKVDSEMPLSRIGQILHARGIRGIVVSPLPPELEEIEWDWAGVSAIAIGPTLRKPALHRVMSDHYSNMESLLKACATWGYRRPGLCLETLSDERIGGQWEACFLRQQTENPLFEKVPLMKYADLSDSYLLHWIRDERPDVVICSSPWRILSIFEKADIRLPEDVGLASVSAARPDGDLSGIVEDGFSAGAQSVSQLLRMVYANEVGLPENPLKILLPGRVYRGRTTR